MSSFITVEVYSINDTNFGYGETGEVPTPDAARKAARTQKAEARAK